MAERAQARRRRYLRRPTKSRLVPLESSRIRCDLSNAVVCPPLPVLHVLDGFINLPHNPACLRLGFALHATLQLHILVHATIGEGQVALDAHLLRTHLVLALHELKWRIASRAVAGKWPFWLLLSGCQVRSDGFLV